MAINNPLLNVLNTNSTNPVDLLRDIKVPPQPKRFGDRFRNMTPEKKQGLTQMLYLLGGALKGNDMSKDMAMLQQNQQLRTARDNAAKLNAAIDGSNLNPAQKELAKANPQLFAKYQFESQFGNNAAFEGAGFNNQLLNTLIKGQSDPSIRNTPLYATAYNYLSEGRDETYTNEQGKLVTKKGKAIINKSDYLPPEGQFVPTQENTNDSEEIVVEVSQERRKDLIKNMTVLDNTIAKLNTFEKKIDEIDPGIFTLGTERADIDNAYTTILLELKNLEELGVLAGPDLDLLQGMLGDPTGWMQNIKSGGSEGTIKQIQNIKDYIAEKKARFGKELGQEVPTPEGARSEQTAYLNGRMLVLNADKSGWVYKDTGEPAQ